jgi:uncharacterized protein
MSTGLLALLDDISALVKATAMSLDDVGAQVAKTSGKVSGIVIDDAAVTPKYVVGLDPKRELSIIAAIAKRSLVNKLLILAPAILLLGAFAPWAMKPLLMIGGAFLCFEGYEKFHALIHPKAHGAQAQNAEPMEEITPEQLEKMRIASAVKTDFILSAEIVAITYANVADTPLANQMVVVVSIAIAITIAVYGFVGLVVKADDVGLHLAKHSRRAWLQGFGRGLVRAMPGFLKVLGVVGTAAMLWVGGEIVAHGIAPVHHALEALKASLATQPLLAWAAKALACALGGLVIGAIVAKLVAWFRAFKRRRHAL